MEEGREGKEGRGKDDDAHESVGSVVDLSVDVTREVKEERIWKS